MSTLDTRELVRPRVLALIPSSGLGGGIESYVSAVLEGLETAGVGVEPLVLRSGPDAPLSMTRKLSFSSKAIRAAAGRDDLVIIAFLASLAPVAIAAKALAGGRARGYVVHHGWEIWTAGRLRRRWDATSRLHQVAVSSFSAGALASRASATVLHPGIPRARFSRLSAHERGAREESASVRLLSVFRLAEAEGKGAYRLIEASRRLRRDGLLVELTIAGRGPAPPSLVALGDSEDWLTVVASPTDPELDAAYGAADLFVLATSTTSSRERPSGEGFGIVLAEAALAGLPVVAPASGGSLDAYLDGVTGLRPADDTAEALARVIRWAGTHGSELTRLGENGRVWARSTFNPDTYSRHTANVFLGGDEPVVSRLELRGAP